MIELKSVSNPSVELEAMDFAEPPRKTLAGSGGSLAKPASLSADRLLVHGKGELIRRPEVDNVLESVIGADDRTRILDTEGDPWRRICALSIRSASGASFVGTGWLAGPRTLITAGHCVNHSPMGGWAQSIAVSPARNGSDLPFATVTSTDFSTLDVWIERRDPDFDLAAIHLPEPIGDELGWFATASLPAGEMADHMVNISGYPFDRGAGTEQWFHQNRVLRVSDRRVFYDVDTFGGHSGAPVWIHEDAGAEPLVVAIHAYGIGGTPASFGITANSGPRIIPEVLDQIGGWVERDSAGTA